ncbi:MAG TPA: HlyD family secretion protein [Bryobacteraceae bacterium]|nr:HlyD family secretion protein [Bryobacteraceae bacterium]
MASQTEEVQTGQEQSKQKPEPPRRQDHDEEAPRRRGNPLLKWVIILVVLAVLIIGGYFLWQYFSSYESTDDAQVDGHIDAVSSRISGTVTAVYVENNQMVQAGQPLVDLDPRDYQVALEQAKAAVGEAQSQVTVAHPSIPITQTSNQTTISTAQTDIIGAEAGVSSAQQNYQAALAKIHQAEANNAKAQADVARYQQLVAKDEISKQQFDAAVAAAKADAAAVASNQASADAALQQVDQAKAKLQQARDLHQQALSNAPNQLAIQRANVVNRTAAVKVYQAQLDQAILNLSYTKIVAPAAGIIGKRSVELGNRVQPGQQLMAIVRIDKLWVTANFKETQLQHMKPGQRVKIHVDALDRDYDGYVESMPGATGALYSLLPPENATGNYVKVVQRLPVRIFFKDGEDKDHLLRPGMSVEPKVYLQ